LNKILELAEMHEVDLVTIAGDVFNTVEDAEGLRPLLRSKFSNLDFEIIAIPGNHDLDAYAGNLNFGSDLTLVTDEPYQVLKRKDVSIVAVPYVDRPDEELLRQLKREAETAESCVLLLHCTLDIGYSTGDFGEETRYFPVSKKVLESLGFDHVLAGHFHRDTHLRRLEGKGFFVYPGSPVSLSKSEQGQRNVVLFDDWNRPVALPLPTFYYDSKEFFVRPDHEDDVLGEIREWYDVRCGDNCSLDIVVGGFITLDENMFSDRIKQVCENAELDLKFRDVSEVLNHPLYVSFVEKMRTEKMEHEDQVQQLVMDAIARLLRTREIRG